jgi:DNA-binding MarR family transcriptional regulator
MTRDIEPYLQGTYSLLMRAARLIQRRQNDALAPLRLTRAAVIALEELAPRPLNQEQLAAKVHVQSQTLGKVLARLEAGGFITRTRNPADRRELRLQLTPAGAAALAVARQAEIEAFPSTLDAEDWHILQEQLNRFVTALQLPPRPTPSPAVLHELGPASGHENHRAVPARGDSPMFTRRPRSGPPEDDQSTIHGR